MRNTSWNRRLFKVSLHLNRPSRQSDGHHAYLLRTEHVGVSGRVGWATEEPHPATRLEPGVPRFRRKWTTWTFQAAFGVGGVMVKAKERTARILEMTK